MPKIRFMSQLSELLLALVNIMRQLPGIERGLTHFGCEGLTNIDIEHISADDNCDFSFFRFNHMRLFDFSNACLNQTLLCAPVNQFMRKPYVPH